MFTGKGCLRCPIWGVGHMKAFFLSEALFLLTGCIYGMPEITTIQQSIASNNTFVINYGKFKTGWLSVKYISTSYILD